MICKNIEKLFIKDIGRGLMVVCPKSKQGICMNESSIFYELIDILCAECMFKKEENDNG